MQVTSESAALIDPIRGQLEHLLSDEAPTHRLQISVASEDVVIPQQVTEGFTSANYEALMDFHSASLIITSRNENTTLVLTQSARFQYDRPDLSRVVLQAAAGGNVFALHGGGISWGQEPGILITAKGGSGKSTAVAAAVAAGAKTIGDDFILGELVGQNFSLKGWSLFSSVRLEQTSPARGLFGEGQYPEFEGKKIFNLEKQFPGSVSREMMIGKLVLPCFSSKNFVEPVSKKEALLAILPSSIGLSINKAAALKSISEMVAAIPSYRVGLTPDIHGNSEFLKRIALS